MYVNLEPIQSFVQIIKIFCNYHIIIMTIGWLSSLKLAYILDHPIMPTNIDFCQLSILYAVS
jgi:hypothetical protein